jgi:hypothetical protein
MTFRSFYWAAAAALLMPFAARAQDAIPAPSVPPQVIIHHALPSIAEPPVPDDPLELVTSDAQPVVDADQRAADLNMLDRAKDLSDLRMHPYDLNTIFTATGSNGSAAEWVTEDIAPGEHIYRWSADGPSFSGIFLNKDDLYSSNRPNNAIPLRLAQVRNAIFYEYTWVHQHASVREATGNLGGVELHCILIAHSVGDRILTGARNWDEYEYCIDPNTGLLATYSPAPGIYCRYDFTGAFHFHGKIIPNGFTITEGGRIVVEDRTLSVTDPVGPDSALFSGEGLQSIGAGWATAGDEVYRFNGSTYIPNPNSQNNIEPQFENFQNPSSPRTMQYVVVAGITGSDGLLAESEVVASTSPALNSAALAGAYKFAQNLCHCTPATAAGAMAPSREVIYLVRFYTSDAS